MGAALVPEVMVRPVDITEAVGTEAVPPSVTMLTSADATVDDPGARDTEATAPLSVPGKPTAASTCMLPWAGDAWLRVEVPAI